MESRTWDVMWWHLPLIFTGICSLEQYGNGNRRPWDGNKYSDGVSRHFAMALELDLGSQNGLKQRQDWDMLLGRSHLSQHPSLMTSPINKSPIHNDSDFLPAVS
jgi:hypothetical protein